MNVVIAGGTGLIGSHLVEALINDNSHIFILTRNAENKKNRDQITYVNWLNDGDSPEKVLENIDVFINLAGASINSRWTDEQKKRIINSRIEATRNCFSLIKRLDQKPSIYLNASAVGFYGTSTSNTYTEDTNGKGTDFLASVVESWENEALKVEETLSIRTVLLRFGVVLAESGGALSKLVLPYKFYVGGTVGSGKQWLSWIHITDVINMILFAIKNEAIRGPINVTAPNPTNMTEFGKTLGNVLNKPHWIPAPSFILKLLLGEMSMLVLEGQRAIPKKAIGYGFEFTYSNLKDALQNLKP